jgi:hypothetical protein
MHLKNLLALFADNGCRHVYVKELSPNDNSKNQVYFGGSFELLNVLPITEVTSEAAGDWKRERFKAGVSFAWIGEDAGIFPAPKAQLILYPKYPEVRFSGFLNGCEQPPSELMTSRELGRVLFLGVTADRRLLGYVAGPNTPAAVEFSGQHITEILGVFKVVDTQGGRNERDRLIAELRRIHELDWIPSKRLDVSGKPMPCDASQCGGYTLEAELGIIPNGLSEPDFLGWEVKQFNVSNFRNLGSGTITLMTPEPNGGIYVSDGVEGFVRRYGYADKMGRADRLNFGGVHKVNEKHSVTSLTIRLIGFDSDTGKIRNSDGRIALVDDLGNEAASWSFSRLIVHWNRKHNQACYVPSMSVLKPERKYRYGGQIILGSGTDFQLFLSEMDKGHIYYDPGIKLEDASTAPRTKRRSQFRIRSNNLVNLYKNRDVVDVSSD